ncbi:MAG: hypothetical protein JOZ41_01960, partial [Chloroflexi bacterium]|nr:hypothetical protein [Chloroflexota bacterium]
MKRLTVIAILLALVGALGEKSAARSPGSAGAVSAAAAAVHATLTDLPLSFEANRGQADARVRFL